MMCALFGVVQGDDAIVLVGGQKYAYQDVLFIRIVKFVFLSDLVHLGCISGWSKILLTPSAYSDSTGSGPSFGLHSSRNRSTNLVIQTPSFLPISRVDLI